MSIQQTNFVSLRLQLERRCKAILPTVEQVRARLNTYYLQYKTVKEVTLLTKEKYNNWICYYQQTLSCIICGRECPPVTDAYLCVLTDYVWETQTIEDESIICVDFDACSYREAVWT